MALRWKTIGHKTIGLWTSLFDINFNLKSSTDPGKKKKKTDLNKCMQTHLQNRKLSNKI